MIYQRTLAKKVELTGIGIHSGKKVNMIIYPAPADSGITFRRVDLDNAKALKADALTVGATENNTTIGEGENVVHTVEHLLAVFYGLGINNAYCEIDGPEIPIMDGSGSSFVFMIKEVGVASLNKTKEFMVILEPVEVKYEDKWARIEPSPTLEIDSTIVFAHPRIGWQQKKFVFTCDHFISEISRARTFGMLKDVDMLKRKGLIKGGSLNNAIVLDDFHVVNPEGVRFKDEYVRHKILDTIGDISLLGYEVAGKITTFKSGHHIHNLLCRKLLETPSAYKIVSATALQAEMVEAYELSPSMSSVFH